MMKGIDTIEHLIAFALFISKFVKGYLLPASRVHIHIYVCMYVFDCATIQSLLSLSAFASYF